MLVATGTYRALFSRVIYTEWIFFALMTFGLMRLRRRKGYAPTRSAAWGYPVVQALFGVSALAVAANADSVRSPTGRMGISASRARIACLLLRYSSSCPSLIFIITTIRPHIWTRSAAESSAVEVSEDADGNPLIYYPGDYNICVPGHRDIDYREQVLIEHGVDTQVITLTTPGTHVETPANRGALRELW